MLRNRLKCIGNGLGGETEVRMAGKQCDADKAEAMKEYQEARDAAIQRIAKLRAARLARDAGLQPQTKTKPKS